MTGNQAPNKKAAKKTAAKKAAKKTAKAGRTPVPASEPVSKQVVPVEGAFPSDWVRMNRVDAQLVAAGLVGLEAHTEAQLEQVGRIIADELGVEASSKACVSLGSAGLAFNRALKVVLAK